MIAINLEFLTLLSIDQSVYKNINHYYHYTYINVLSRASKVGSPTNPPCWHATVYCVFIR